jgi:hypothetical protein
MTGKYKIGKLSKEDYKKFLKKAEEFYEMMQQGLKRKTPSVTNVLNEYTSLTKYAIGV